MVANMKLAEHNHSRISTIFNKETCEAMANNCPRCAQLALLQQIVDDLKEELATLNIQKKHDHIYPFRVLFLEELIKEYEAIIEGAK